MKYLVDLPLSYSVGAMLIDKRKWKKLSEEHQKLIRKIADKYVNRVNEGNIEDNKKALQAIRSTVEFIEFSEKDQKLGKEYRKEVVKKLKGDLFSKEALKRLNKHLKD